MNKLAFIFYSVFLIFLGSVLFCLVFAGCTPLENSARDAAAAAQGFIAQAQQNHLAECQATPTKPFPCVMINQAVGAQNLLVSAIEEYCGWPANPDANALAQYANQPCSKKANFQARLQNAVTSLNSIMAEYKLASQGK